MLYDLHIHSCLSPCADNDMTPATIAGMAKLEGADIIAVCDHNSALNLPATKIACDEYGLTLLPGIEVTTQEEIHVLCYFKTVENALKFGELLYENLPDIMCEQEVWGNQFVCDEHDRVIKSIDKLLTSAVSFDIYEIKELCKKYGGIPVPAHIEKDSASLLSVLGFLPEDLTFTMFEVKTPEKLVFFTERELFPKGKSIITSSDAHMIEHIAKNLNELDEECDLYKFIQNM